MVPQSPTHNVHPKNGFVNFGHQGPTDIMVNSTCVLLTRLSCQFWLNKVCIFTLLNMLFSTLPEADLIGKDVID